MKRRTAGLFAAAGGVCFVAMAALALLIAVVVLAFPPFIAFALAVIASGSADDP
jgi:hypothetical protein